MPQGRSENFDNFKLVKKQIKNNFELRVVSLEQYLKIEEAALKKSNHKIIEQRMKEESSAHATELRNIEESRQAELSRIRSTTKTRKDAESQIYRANQKFDKQRHEAEEKFSIQRTTNEAALLQAKKEAEKQANEIAVKYADNQYKKANIYQKQQIQQKRKDLAQAYSRELTHKKKLNDVEIANLVTERKQYEKGSEERFKIEQLLSEKRKEQRNLQKEINSSIDAECDATRETARLTQVILSAKIAASKSNNNNGAAELLSQVESARATAQKELEDITITLNAREELNLDKEEIERLENSQKTLTETISGLTATAADLYEAASSDEARIQHEEATRKYEKTKARSTDDMAQAIADERKQEQLEAAQQAEANWKYFASEEGMKDAQGKAVVEAISNLSNKLTDALNQIDKNIDAYYAYQASIEARLQGSDESYKKSLANISQNVGLSGLVKQKDVIENLKKLSEAGIAYNLDLRAFLATITDEIAQTFDVFDSNLLRLIRLQQSDTTVARLGMEASLTRLFNEYFSDTSYLSDAANSVSQAIIDANSQLTRDMPVEFEYMVQKWLGALYSLGMDSGTISTIAQGLNYLGTGNVEALNGNSSLQSLLAMSASRAGISYADILTGGLDAETTNSLMKSMIEYLKSIAENTDNNQVTKSAYSNVFGFSISDLTAVSSLSTQDINNLYKQSLDYTGAMDEYTYQANQILSRTHFSQMLSTVFENALMTASTGIGNNPGTYALWKVLNVVEDLTGGIAIPAISIMGNMVDLHQTVTGLAKTGIAGLGLMGSLLSSLFGGSLFGTTDYNSWGYDEFTRRGSSVKGISKGTAFGVSESSSLNMVGSSSTSDIKTTSLSDATDNADEDSKITNKNVQDEADIYKKIYQAIGNEETSVLQEVVSLNSTIHDYWDVTNQLLREDRRFKTEMTGLESLYTLLDSKRVFLSSIVSMLPLTSTNFRFDEETNSLTVVQDALDTIAGVTTSSQNSKTATIDTLTPQTTPYKTVVTESPDGTKYTKLLKLESTLSQVDIDNIANLMAQTSVGIHDSNDKTTNQLITNEGLKVSINQLSPEVSAYIAATVKTMVASAFTGGVSEMGEDGEGIPLLSQLLTNLIQSNTLNVNVTNDNFDTALQQTAFSR